MRRFALMAACSLLALAPAGGSASGAAGSTHSFEGSCAIVGNAVLAHPLGLLPSQRSFFVFRGEGRCQGTLDGEVLPQAGAPARLVSSGPRAIHSCPLGYDPGIRFALTLYPKRPGPTIFGEGDIIDVVRGQYSVVRGQRGGIGVAVNTLQGHSEVVRRCAAGEIREGTVGLQFDTVTPVVSGESED